MAGVSYLIHAVKMAGVSSRLVALSRSDRDRFSPQFCEPRLLFRNTHHQSFTIRRIQCQIPDLDERT
eukprot:scaffold9896_cov74-Cylindrotheca_fusiformis.AAC.4